MTDALAGYREAINERKVTVLKWPASKPCPVEKGERYKLRSCEVEIDTINRKLVKGKGAEWHVTFVRHERDVPQLLRFTPPTRAPRETDSQLGMTETEKARREGNYTSSLKSASPHEPESVGPDWVDPARGTRELKRQEARRQERAERDARETSRLVRERVTHIFMEAVKNGNDISSAVTAIYALLDEASQGTQRAA